MAALEMQPALDLALTRLLATSTGASALAPVAMLPVRLETRTFRGATGGTEIKVRIYVDNIHVDAHDPRLTDDEAAWSQHVGDALQRAIATGKPDDAQAVWAQAAEHLGSPRAAYLMNPDRAAGTRTGPFHRAATAACLPERWFVIAYGPDGLPIAAKLGGPIPTNPLLQVGPDPSYSPQVPTDGSPPPIDPKLEWMVDFKEAEDNGMGVTLSIDAGAAGARVTNFAKLIAIGVRAADGSTALANLLAAHHYTNGLEFVPHGTPTNNTGDSPSGFQSSDPGHLRSFGLEVGPLAKLQHTPSGYRRADPTGDAVGLAGALGIAPIVFGAAGDPLYEQPDQAAMATLIWPVTWGSFLTDMVGLDAGRVEDLRTWAAMWVKPGGPMPTLRVGTRPYGILPVIALDGWTDNVPGTAADVHHVVSRLLRPWVAAAAALAPSADFDSLLARRPESADAGVRFMGILTGWLPDHNDLLDVGWEPIQNTIDALPARLQQIGQAVDGGRPLNFPGGSVVFPDPMSNSDPWRLIAPHGTLPFVTGPKPDYAAPSAYLRAIASGAQRPGKPTLLDLLARASWETIRRAPPPRPRPRPGPGGEPGGDGPPPVARASADLTAAVSYLAGRDDADFEELLGGALDATSHRLDAWVTSLASARLAQLRSKQASGLIVGGFGWIENLEARPPLNMANPPIPDEPRALEDPANAGYLLAPSIQQATTAAVLRSGFLTHNPIDSHPPIGAPFAVDLSSRRARLAGWLVDGVRQGQPLAALLGYRFERALQEAHRGDLIDEFRHIAPYDGALGIDSTKAPDPAESVRAGDVVDGIALLRMWQSTPQPVGRPWDSAHQELSELADAADAVADAVLAQALHDSLTGATHTASATFESVANGSVPPPALQFMNTVRTGIAINQRVLLPLPAGTQALPAGWTQTPRGHAEPALDHWVATLLGNPTDTSLSVQLLDAYGANIGNSVQLKLSALGLGPLDVIAIAAQPDELEKLAIFKAAALRKSTDPPFAAARLIPTGSGGKRSLAAVLAVARSAGRLIGTGRGADVRDLLPAGSSRDPSVNLGDLAARVTAAESSLHAAATALAAAVPGGISSNGHVPGMLDPAPSGTDASTLAAALLSALSLGIPHTAPAGYGPQFADLLLGQSRAAWNECTRRLNTIAAAEPKSGNSPADHLNQLAARLSQLTTAFGGGFRALPQITTNPPDLVATAAAATTIDRTDAGQAPEAWIYKVSRVHPAVADFLDAWCGAEAIHNGSPLAVTVAQLPLPATGTTKPWVGQAFVNQPHTANTLSLVLAGSAAPPSGAFCALLVADWIEVIPSQSEVTAVAYHYDAPTAQAPQAILLAVPARVDATEWTYGDLLATVNTVMDLAHARTVDYADLPPLARLVLPAAYFRNPDEQNAALPATLPASYLKPVPHADIASVDQVRIVQAKGGVIVVHGSNFGPPIKPTDFSVDGDGVTITGGTIDPNGTLATLNAGVAATATPSARHVHVGSSVSPGASVTIAPTPLATYCDTVQLTQQLVEVTQRITVTGIGLSGAAVSLTGYTLSPSVVTADTMILVTVTIPASTYDPNTDGDSRGDSPYYKPHAPRQPRHRVVDLKLTVTPIDGQAATYDIKLDTIS